MTHSQRISEDHPRRSTRLLGLLLLTAALVGCATSHPPTVLNELPESGRRARILVKNQHRHAVEVAVIPGANVFELGAVGPASSRAFRLALQYNGVPARVRIRCLAGEDLFTSQEIVWEGGQVIDLQVQPILSLSRVTIPRF